MPESILNLKHRSYLVLETLIINNAQITPSVVDINQSRGRGWGKLRILLDTLFLYQNGLSWRPGPVWYIGDMDINAQITPSMVGRELVWRR